MLLVVQTNQLFERLCNTFCLPMCFWLVTNSKVCVCFQLKLVLCFRLKPYFHSSIQLLNFVFLSLTKSLERKLISGSCRNILDMLERGNNIWEIILEMLRIIKIFVERGLNKRRFFQSFFVRFVFCPLSGQPSRCSHCPSLDAASGFSSAGKTASPQSFPTIS